MWFVGAAHAEPTCVGPDCPFADLGAALADPAFDVIEIHGGVHPGPFTVDHVVELIGTDDARLRLPLTSGGGFPLLTATRSLTLRTLTLDANLVDAQLWATGQRVVLDRVTMIDGWPTADRASVTIDASVVELVGTELTGTIVASASMAIHADTVTIVDARFAFNAPTALEITDASTVTIDGLVAVDNGRWAYGISPGALSLVDVASFAVSRSWFCGNQGGIGGAVSVRGGCGGDPSQTAPCTIDHAVLSGNHARIGGGIAWDAPVGAITHATLYGNWARERGRALAVQSGKTTLDHTLIVQRTGLVSQVAAIDLGAAGALDLARSAIRADVPGVVLGADDLALDTPPVPASAVYVPGACGSSVTVDPRDPANAPFAAWPDEDAIGALTTDDCGPWCADDDADGVPAMWDCGPDDPSVGTGLPEIGLDGADQDCDGLDACFVDGDGDGWGGALTAIPIGGSCPTRAVPQGGDCDDVAPEIHPLAGEAAGDGVDRDCDGAELCYVDADDDGVTSLRAAIGAVGDLGCADPGVGPVADGDCDDSDPAVVVTRCSFRLVGGACATGPGGAAGALGTLVVALVARKGRSRRQ